jgi:hypothetical protein
MRKLLDVVRRWLAPPASAVRWDERVIVVNETGGFVYEVTPDSHSSEHADTRVNEPSINGPSPIVTPAKEGLPAVRTARQALAETRTAKDARGYVARITRIDGSES